MLELNKIYNIDSLEGLKQLDNESIDCVMTSPPYWALRDYGVEGQIGLEPTFQEYITKLIYIFDEVKRVLKKTGTCWVNIGDSYSGSNCGAGDSRLKGEGGLQHVTDGYFPTSDKEKYHENLRIRLKENILPNKSLCLIPFRFAIAMQERGWILRNDIVWFKRNSMPSSVKDRFSNKWEHVFFFVKSKKYYFDLDAVRKQYLQASVNPINAGFSEKVHFNYRVREAAKGTLAAKFGDKYKVTEQEISEYGNKTTFNKTKYNISLENAEALGDPRAREVRYKDKVGNGQLSDKAYQRKVLGIPHDEANIHPLGGNPGDHWDITTQPHPFAHFACYPERLCETPIKAGCPKDGIVLDPFIGSGTTALVAKRLGRNFIGFELNPSYIEIAKKRLRETENPLTIYTK